MNKIHTTFCVVLHPKQKLTNEKNSFTTTFYNLIFMQHTL